MTEQFIVIYWHIEYPREPRLAGLGNDHQLGCILHTGYSAKEALFRCRCLPAGVVIGTAAVMAVEFRNTIPTYFLD